jgi:hypothetical protein
VTSRLSLEAAITVPLLKAIWRKAIRKPLRAMRLPDVYLGKDPLEHLDFEWEMDARLPALRDELLAGRYRARAPEVVRGAKGSGLTRPLAFLDLNDQIVYKLIIAAAESSLLANSPPWTRLGRFAARDEEQAAPESGWFRSFILRQGQIWRITMNHEWVVETDVANFFPYVHLPSVLAHLHTDSNLSPEVIRVLEHMLVQFSPMPEYRHSPTVGLPQEIFDCSRVIAHTYLRVVDDEFRVEGEADRYSRFMDDIVVGAQTYEEALQQVRRVQTSLERVGLYPNTAKTRIVRRQDFAKDYMKLENDFLGEVEESIRDGSPNRPVFRTRLRKHLGAATKPPRAWSRVLRRYYTISRRLGDDYLLERAHSHLVEFPESARWIFEYLTTFRLTPGRFDRLLLALDRLGGVYEDVDLLAHEYACLCPQARSDNLYSRIADWGTRVFEDTLESNPRLAGVACMTLGKFGGDKHHDVVDRNLEHALRGDAVVGRQALVLLMAIGRVGLEDLPALAPRMGPRTLSQASFLRAIMLGETRAVNMALFAMKPSKRKDPERFVVRPRLLFLAPLIRRAGTGSSQQLDYYAALLAKNEARFRDRAAELWLTRKT